MSEGVGVMRDATHANVPSGPGQGTFDTPGGQTYVQSLRRILPDAEVDMIIKQVEDDDRRRREQRKR
jgi:hypothetical protein